MNTLYQAKLNELMTEFTRYLIENPDWGEQIPQGAQIVLLDRRDPLYSQQAIQYAAGSKTKDDNPQRPVVYIEVTEIRPIRSRVQKLQILENPPVYTV